MIKKEIIIIIIADGSIIAKKIIGVAVLSESKKKI